MRFEPKNDLEKEADRLLAEDTRKRGSGVNVRSPRPAREVLSDDLAPLGSQAATFDEYPSDAEYALEENARARMLKVLCERLLTDRQAECLDLVVLRGWSYHAAADELSLSPGTVHSYVKAALDKLRSSMEDSPTAALLFPEIHDDES
jgi:DNA-directed RNA polymerase specialized sigma24 family protein